MYNLEYLDTSALMELLAQQTAIYTSKIAERNNHFVELSKYEYDIAMIQSELNKRKMAGDNSFSDVQ